MPDSTFSHAEFPPGMENTPSFPGKQFLQGKEEFTLPDMESMPVLSWNQSIQGNEKNMDTRTFTSGSTTLNRLSTLTHPRKSSTKLPTTGDGKFQHSGTSMLQSQC